MVTDMNNQEFPLQSGTMQNVIHVALQGIWDRAQQAVDLITRLRVENASLGRRIEEMEAAHRAFEAQLAEKDHQIAELQERMATPASVDVGEGLLYLSAHEREALERQINDLITRITAHLGSPR